MRNEERLIASETAELNKHIAILEDRASNYQNSIKTKKGNWSI